VSQAVSRPRIAGICFSRQYPNPAEPIRGTFVAEQVAATAHSVDWRVIAPLAWPQRSTVAPVPRSEVVDGVPVARPRVLMLPRRIGWAGVAGEMARTARPDFDAAVADDARFVHAHELYPSAAAARILAQRAGLPLVVSVHGSDLYTNLAKPRWRELVASTAAAAAAVICVSSALARDLVAELGIDEGRVHVVPDTYDAARFAFVDRPQREAGAPVRLLTIGRLSAEKGVDVLLEALAALKGRVDVSARIVGDGAERARLHERAAALGLSGTAEFLGALSGDALAAELAAADLYCQPSRREGFGVALVEALATGLPAVATDSGGPADIVTRRDGVLVAPGDATALAEAIERAASSLESFDRAAIAAATLERFGPESVGARLAALYAEVAS